MPLQSGPNPIDFGVLPPGRGADATFGIEGSPIRHEAPPGALKGRSICPKHKTRDLLRKATSYTLCSAMKPVPFLLVALAALPAAAERFPVTARILCPASLNADGTLDATFTVTPTLVPCAGIRVTAMDADPLWDEYCGSAYTDSQGRVTFSAECSDGNAPDVYLKVEARSMLGFSVGTHDYGVWDALADVASLGVSFGTTLPFEVVDYLSAHETFAWITSERAPTNKTLAFGDLAAGFGPGFDAEAAIQRFAGRQFWANQMAMQRLRATATKAPMDFNYTVDAPIGPPVTIWDTVIVEEDLVTGTACCALPGAAPTASCTNPDTAPTASCALAASPHEIGHVIYNTYHSVLVHWLLDAPDYITRHASCEQGHFMTLAWYEGFAEWVRHVAYGRLDWTSNQLHLPPPTTGVCGTPGFNLEDNVTAVLDALYFGPVAGRLAIDLSQFACAPGFTLVQDAMGVVRCERTFDATCASRRTRHTDGHGNRDTCELPGVEQMTQAEIFSEQQICAQDRAPCPPMEVYRYSSCSAGVVERIAGRDRCRETINPTHAFPGGVPLPRGDGTPNRVVGHDSAGALRWFPLADADTIIGWVQQAGTSSHRMLEMWNGWARPWCTTNTPEGFARYCDPVRSPDFVAIVAAAADAATVFP